MPRVSKVRNGPAKTATERRRNANSAWNRRNRSAAIECDIPEWSEPSPRREACRLDLVAFIREYLPARFPLPMSADHIQALNRMQDAILTGGQYAQAAPRGDGKTERSIAAVLWATLYAHARFVPVIGADLNAAKSIVQEIHAELANNERIAEDWPQVCYPFAEVLANPNRARFLTHGGKPLNMEAKTHRLVFPSPAVATLDPACGAIVLSKGLTSSLRGLRHKQLNGATIRPDLVVIDDPQTDESANSPEQCKTREALVSGAILGLAGPNKKIAAIANMTIIRMGDLAHRLLDPQLHPEWHGVRYCMVYDWPEAKDTLWKQYAELRRDAMRNGNAVEACREFYLANREAMDKGARVGWEHRKREGEASALQCAMNILIDHGEETFFAEYQNDPRPMIAVGWEITPEKVTANLSGVPRGTVPYGTEVVTLGADVNLYGINWVLQAWTMDGVGYVVDWGRFPASSDKPIWDAKVSTISEEQAIFGAICAMLEDVVLSRPYMRGKERVYPNGVAIDCGYKPLAVIRAVQAMRSRMGAAQVMPIRGIAGRKYRPLGDCRKGDGWHIAPYTGVRATFINADTWRERAQKAFLLPVGSPDGSLSLYGKDPRAHIIYAEHITAERIIDVLTGERLGVMYEWGLLPGRKNDLLDSTVYAMACAGYLGVRFGQGGTLAQRPSSAPIAKPSAPSPAVPAMPAAKPAFRRPHHNASRQRGGFATSW